MISWMQKHRKYLVVTIWISAAAFIAAGSMGWGAYKYGDGGADTVAEVGDIKITHNQLMITTNNIFNYYNSLFGGRLTKEQAKKMGIDQMALQQLIDEAMLLNYAKELGIVALDEDLIKAYQSIPAFQKNGHFDKATFENILRAQGIKKKDFEEGLKKSIIVKKLKTLLSLPVTPLESKLYYSAENLADRLIIKKLDIDPKSIKLGNEELKKYWESHKENYKSPKTYLLSIIETPIDSIKESDIDQEKLKAFYEEVKYQFKDKDGKILPLDKAKDDVIRAYKFKKAKKLALKNYIDFKKGKIKAQKEIKISQDSNTSIDFSQIASLSKGEYLKALKGKNGYITAQVKEIILPKPLPFEDAKAQVAMELRAKKAKEMLEKIAKEEIAKEQIDGKDVGFVTLSDAKKIDIVNPNAAFNFLNYLFSTNDQKKGFYLIGDSALVYEIKEQKLYDNKAYRVKRENTNKKVLPLKNSFIQRGLIEKLREKYKTQLYIKKEERS